MGSAVGVGATALIGRSTELAGLAALIGVDRTADPTTESTADPTADPTAESPGVAAPAGTTAVLVGGDAGVGKTRLLAHLADLARAAGWRVVTGHCLDFGDSALPYLPFSEVVGRLTAEPAAPVVAEVLAAQPTVGRLLPGRRMLPATGADQRDGSRVSIDRQDLFDAVHALLEAVGELSPLLLVIEDVHWADQSTREMLSFLFARGFSAPVVLVVSYRADDLHRRHPLRAQVTEWLRLRGVARLHLEPLDAGAVRELVAQLHPDPLGPDELVEITDRAEGNPFFVEELVGAATGAARRLPADLAEVLLVRLDRLDDPARQVVRAASVAGRRVSHAQLAAVSGIDEAVLDEALRQAVEMNILVAQDAAYAFRHALLAEATYDDLLPGERVRLHAAYADALRIGAASGTAAELARHARLAMDTETAIDASIRAGREAMSVGGPDDATRHFEQALHLLADPRRNGDRTERPEVTELLVETAEALLASGNATRADALLAERLARMPAGGSAADRARLLAARADVMLMIEPDDDPLAVSAEAVALLPEGASSLHAAVLATRAHVLAAYARIDEARAAAMEALAIAEQLDLRLIASDAVTTLSGLKRTEAADVLRAALVDAVDRAIATGASRAELRGRFLIGRSFQDHAEWDEAERWFRSAVSRAEALNTPWAPHAFDARWQLAWMCWLRGRWDELLELTDLTGQTPPRTSRVLLDLLRMQVEFARGKRVEELPSMRRDWAVDGLIGIYACGLGIEVAGRDHDPRAAIAGYDEGVAVMTAIWFPNFGARIRLAATTAGAIAGNLPQLPAAEWPELLAAAHRLAADGHAVLDSVREPGDFWGPEGQAWLQQLDAELMRVRWLAGVDPPTSAALVATWQQAAAQFDAIGHVYQTATTRAVLSEILRAAGDTVAADRERAAAAAAATTLGAEPLMTRLGARTSASEDTGRTALTSREQEVLELVALGRSNSEIGQQLFISRKTASVHVSNILAKLGASGRTEAVAVARHRGWLS